MIEKLRNIKWNLHKFKTNQLFIWGMKSGYIRPYDDSLIEKLRNIYYGCIPSSIILLCNSLSNGDCYDKSLLLAQALLDNEEDVNLIYATIDSIRLNPEYIDEDPLYGEHCIVERINKNGQHIIYDTSSGLAYDKRIYWLMEHPKVRHINDKKTIKEFLESNEEYQAGLESDEFIPSLILPMIEEAYGRENEIYASLGIELLQREIEHFKKTINYKDIYCKKKI